jgi:hypothetical protein
MPALLVRAHESDTNAWYPVAPMPQPLASAVRRRRRGINAHQRCCKEEQLRAAAEKQTKFWMGSAREMKKMRRARRDASNSNERGKYSGSCEGRDGHPKIRTKRDAVEHLSPESREPVFLRNRRQKGKDSAVIVPAPYRPTGARLRPGPVLMIP